MPVSIKQFAEHDPSIVDKLRAQRAAGTLGPVMTEALEAYERELIGESSDVGKPGHKGVRIAALFLLGASYRQLMHYFQLNKSTIYVGVSRHLGPVIRTARPRNVNKSSLSWEQVDAYFQASLDARVRDISDAVRLAEKIKEIAVTADTPLEPESRIGE